MVGLQQYVENKSLRFILSMDSSETIREFSDYLINLNAFLKNVLSVGADFKNYFEIAKEMRF